jgi:hypothetical protein
MRRKEAHRDVRHRLARYALSSVVVGSLTSIAICWLSAWDLSIPAPSHPLTLDRGPEFAEPAVLRWYRSVTSGTSLILGSRHAATSEAPLDIRATSRETQSENLTTAYGSIPSDPRLTDVRGEFFAGGVYFEHFIGGDRTYDQVIAMAPAFNPSDNPHAVEQANKSWREFWWGEWGWPYDPAPEFEVDEAYASSLGSSAIGTPPADWGNAQLWNSILDKPLVAPTSYAPLITVRLEPGFPLARIALAGVRSRQVSETRLYGWPLRCMTVHGVRVQRWESAEDLGDGMVTVLQDDHWTDAVLDFEHHSNWSFDADQPPATGLPWKPLWLPFLANSLILGVPLTLAGFGVLRTVRWGTARIRGRGDKCPRCGYARTGLARDAACPECGGT